MRSGKQTSNSDFQRAIIIQLENDSDGKEELAGFVILDMPWSQIRPFRANVEKLMISPKFRRRGIARSLMDELEEMAKEKGKTLLVHPLS